jgi:hypothetical protein
MEHDVLYLDLDFFITATMNVSISRVVPFSFIRDAAGRASRKNRKRAKSSHTVARFRL